MNVIQIIVETPKAVALRPSDRQGETTAKPKPVPRIISTSDNAAAAAPPAKIAPHDTAPVAFSAAMVALGTGSMIAALILPPFGTSTPDRVQMQSACHARSQPTFEYDGGPSAHLVPSARRRGLSHGPDTR